jgi:DNA-directed RNA polymerase specialized sigma subunit
VSLGDALVVSSEPAHNLMALDEALRALEVIHRRECQVVELRFFGGPSLEETADVLRVSRDPVKRDW